MLLNCVLEKTLESPLDCKNIQPVHPKGDQSWVFTGRTDVETETPILWPPHAKSWLTGKDPNAGKDWGQEKGTTEDETTGWHHRLDGHGFGWTPAVGDGQGGLACCDSWGRNESDTTERLKSTELSFYSFLFILSSWWLPWLHYKVGRKRKKKFGEIKGIRLRKMWLFPFNRKLLLPSVFSQVFWDGVPIFYILHSFKLRIVLFLIKAAE